MIAFLKTEDARRASLRGAARGSQRRADRRQDVIYALLDGRQWSVTALEQETGFPRAHIHMLLGRMRDDGLVRRCGMVAYMGKRRMVRESLWERGLEMRAPAGESNEMPAAPRPQRQPQVGSGQIAGPVYYRGLAGFGGWRGMRW